MSDEFHLEFPNHSHEKEYFIMMDEWVRFGGRIYPGALRDKGEKYDAWLSRIKNDEDINKLKEGRAPQTLFFLKEKAKRGFTAPSA